MSIMFRSSDTHRVLKNLSLNLNLFTIPIPISELWVLSKDENIDFGSSEG